MKTIPPETEIEAEESDFKPLTAEEAEVWRSRNPSISVWKVVAGALTGRASVGWSAAYGALAVVAPAALFARGVLRHSASSKPRAAMVGFFGWEIAKIVLAVALLAAAPRLVSGLSWIALLVGMVVAMKTYWVALLVRPGVRKTD